MDHLKNLWDGHTLNKADGKSPFLIFIRKPTLPKEQCQRENKTKIEKKKERNPFAIFQDRSYVCTAPQMIGPAANDPEPQKIPMWTAKSYRKT